MSSNHDERRMSAINPMGKNRVGVGNAVSTGVSASYGNKSMMDDVSQTPSLYKSASSNKDNIDGPRVMFSKYDIDGSGAISVTEFRKLCYDMGYDSIFSTTI